MVIEKRERNKIREERERQRVRNRCYYPNGKKERREKDRSKK
jgi:hypothetical protein